jgi:hypothetical protein
LLEERIDLPRRIEGSFKVALMLFYRLLPLLLLLGACGRQALVPSAEVPEPGVGQRSEADRLRALAVTVVAETGEFPPGELELGIAACDLSSDEAFDAAIALDRRSAPERTARLDLNWTIPLEPRDYARSCLYARWLVGGSPAWGSIGEHPVAEFDPERAPTLVLQRYVSALFGVGPLPQGTIGFKPTRPPKPGVATYRSCSLRDGAVVACGPPHQGSAPVQKDLTVHSCDIQNGRIVECDPVPYSGRITARTLNGYQDCVVTAGRMSQCDGPASGDAVIAAE